MPKDDSEDERGAKGLEDVPERAQNRLFVLSHEIAPHEHRREVAIAPQVSEVQIEPSDLRPDDQVPLFGSRLIYNGRAQALLSFADLKDRSIAAVQGPTSSDICGDYCTETLLFHPYGRARNGTRRIRSETL